MANLSADASLRFLAEPRSIKWVMDTSSAQTIYKGGPVILDANVDTVYAVTAAGVTCVDGDVFLGIAAGQKSVSASASEVTEIELYIGPSVIGFKSAVFTDADAGKTVYMSDTGTLTASNGAYPQIGKLIKVVDGYAYVELTAPQVLNVP